MYKVKFIKQIHMGFASAQTGDVYVHYDAEIPFVPSPDLFYEFGDVEIESNSFQQFGSQGPSDLNEVYYKGEEEGFWFYTPANKERYNDGLHKRKSRPIEEIVKEYTDMGWKVWKTW